MPNKILTTKYQIDVKIPLVLSQITSVFKLALLQNNTKMATIHVESSTVSTLSWFCEVNVEKVLNKKANVTLKPAVSLHKADLRAAEPLGA